MSTFVWNGLEPRVTESWPRGAQRVSVSVQALLRSLFYCLERTIEREGLWERMTTEDRRAPDAALPRAYQSIRSIRTESDAPVVSGGSLMARTPPIHWSKKAWRSTAIWPCPTSCSSIWKPHAGVSASLGGASIASHRSFPCVTPLTTG